MRISNVIFRLVLVLILTGFSSGAIAATTMLVQRDKTGGTIGPLNTVGDDLCPADPTNGCDFDETDDTVRTNDGVSYKFSVTADGPEDVVLNAVLELGMVWEDLPPSCNPLTSSLTGDGITTSSVLNCDLGNQSGYAEDILLVAQVLGSNPNGATSGLASAEFTSNVSPDVIWDDATQPVPDVNISAAPRANLRKDFSRQDVGQDLGVNGLIVTYKYYFDMWQHDTNGNGTDDPDPLMGNELVQAVALPNGQMGFKFTEDMDLGFSDAPNAYILSCTIDTGTGVQLPNTLLSAALPGRENRSVIDAGSNACSSTGPGARTVDVYHWDADLSLSHVPTQNRGGGALPGDRSIATFGSIRVFIPLTDFENAPTPGEVRGTNQIYGFEPTSISGQTNFLGNDQNAGDDTIDATAEDKDDNINSRTFVEAAGSFSHLYRCAVPGDAIAPQCVNWTSPPTTAGANWSGDGAIEPTQDLGFASSTSYNNRTFLPVENLKLCEVIDTSLYEVVDRVATPGQASRVTGGGAGVNGVDYIIEYGVGYETAWPPNPAVASGTEVVTECNGGPNTTWYPSTTAALAAGLGPITKVKMTRLTDLPIGNAVNLNTNLAALPDTGDPNGTLLVTQGTYMEDRFQTDWRECEHVAGQHNIPAVPQSPNGCGDRVYLTRSLARMNKETVPNDDINTMAAGGSVIFRLFPSFTSVAGNNVEPVSIVDSMPLGFEYIPNSATQAGVPFEPVVTGDLTVGETLTWNLGPIPANAFIEPITFQVRTPITTENGTVLPNIARTDAASDGSTEQQRGDQRNVTVVAPISMVMAKQVDQVLVDQDIAFEYTVQYLNTTPTDFNLVDIIDVIPFNGDNRFPAPTAFLGTTAIGNANAVSLSHDFYFTKDAPGGVVTNATDASNTLATGSTNWCLAVAGNVDPGATPTNGSAAANCPANATEVTAIRIVDTEVMPQSTLREFKFTLTPSNNVGGDQYSNRAQGFADAITLQPNTNLVTTVVREADRMVELEKSVAQINGNEVTFDLYAENTGDTPLNSLTLIDDLDAVFGAGNYTVSAGPTIVAAPPTGSFAINPNFSGAAGATAGVANNDIFDPTATSLLPVGEGGTVTVTITIDNVVDNQGLGLGNFENSATVGGTTPQGATVTDVSDDPNGAGPEDNNPAPIALIPAIGTAKEATSLVPVGMGNYEVTYTMVIENTGFVPLHDVQLVDDLTGPFGTLQASLADVDAAGEYFVSAGPTITVNSVDALAPNTSFTGTAPDIGLLDVASGGSLDFGETATLTIQVTFRPDPANSPYNNQTTVSGDTVDDGDTDATDGVTDLSDDGVDPDPDGDGDATEDTGSGGDSDENDPTPLEISAIGVAKEVKSLTPNSDGTFTVVYSVVTENFGNTILHDVQLTDDLTAPFGTNVATAADVNISGEYYVDTSLITFISNAADPFTVNTSFDGNTDQGLLSIPDDGSLAVGESISMEFSVLFYPDFSRDPYNNQITASGDLLDDNDTDPSDGVADLSDDGADPDPDGDGFANESTDGTGDSDENDPTPLELPAIRNAKSLTSIVPSTTMPAHFDATFQIVVENTGNVDLDNLTLVDDIATQLGSTYDGVVVIAPAIVAAATTATTEPSLGTFPINIFAGNDGLLKPGEIITVEFTIELNLAAVGAPDPLTNQSTAGGNPPGGDPNDPNDNVTDLSDDGTDPSSDNPDAPGDNGAGGTDDPTPIGVDSISLAKTVASFVPSTTTPGNFDVTYNMVIQNTGTTILDNLVLRDILDDPTNLGSAFKRVVTMPSIVAAGTTATTDPGLLGTFTGSNPTSQIFDGTSGILEPGQTIAITMVVEVDPDAEDAPSPLQNQAQTGGNPPGGDPANPKDNVFDDSDSGTNPTSANSGEPGDTGGTDDPVPLIIADISTVKAVSEIVANASNPLYNDVTFQILVKNTGTVDLENLTLVDDINTRFGSTLKAVLAQPSFITAATTATTSPTLDDLPNVFVGDDGLLKPGEVVAFEFTLTLDFADPDAPLPLTNQATAGGTVSSDIPNVPLVTVTDLSDDGTNPDTSNPGSPGDNGAGGTDDPTPMDFNSISLSKTQSGVAANATRPDNFDVTYTLVVQNTGTTILDNLTLVDQLDAATNLGNAFVAVTTDPVISADTATTIPGINGAYDGKSTNPGIFNGTSGVLEPGQTITVVMVVEVDPDAMGAPSPLLNQATVGGNPPNGDPLDPIDDVTDLSDSGTDPVGTNSGEPGDTGGSDDPVPLIIADISITKEQFSVEQNAANPLYTDIGMRLVVKNTGTVDLDNLTLVDDVATQLGSTYKAVLTAPSITTSTATTDPSLGAFPINVFSGSDGLLKPAETITLEFVLTLELGAANAPVPLTNQVTVSGNPPGGDPNNPADNVSDDSDTGSNPSSSNPGEPGDTGGSDDPTLITANLISLTKEQAGFAANEIRPDNFDVTYNMVVQNTGTTILDNLTLVDQLNSASNLGVAFIGITMTPNVSGTPVITGGTATTMPGLNAGYNGATNTGIFDGTSGVLEPGQTIELTMVVEVDPDITGAPSPLLNQALVGGLPPGGDPSDPADYVTDNSDSGTNPAGTNPDEPGDTGGADDPTPLIITDISLAKSVTSMTPNATDPTHFDVTFTLVVENTGTVDLDNLTLVDDVVTQLGSTYKGVTTAPAITASTATTDPSLGTFPVNVFAGNDGLLEPGQIITVNFVLEMDLSAANAPTPLTNQATVGGNPEGGDPNDPADNVTDLSDDGADPGSSNPGADGDTGGTDDPTPIILNSISLAKNQVAFELNATRPENFDVTYNLVVQNTGTTVLDNLTLLDQLDAATNLGSTFIGITTAPSITGGTVPAANLPGLNAGYDGRISSPGIFNGTSGSIEPGQTIELTMVVEVDPDADGAPSPLLNQASTSGNPPGGDPTDPSDDVTDLSDSGSDPTSTNPNEPGDTGGVDDPTPLGIASIGLAKVQTTAVTSMANPVHWDVGFQLQVINNGTITLENISLIDDVATQLGATYVAVTTAPAISASTATTDPTLGTFPVDVFSGTDGVLEPGQTITIDFVLQMDLANAPIPLTNQAEVTANPLGGDPDDPADDVSDLSDDGVDPSGSNTGSPGDTGGTDDPTPIQVDSISLAKDQTGFAFNATRIDNFDVTYDLVVQNTGTTILDNLTLLDQLDAATNLGTTFIGINTAPSITGGTATTMPGLNAAFDGTAANAGIFDGTSGVLEPGQIIRVNMVVEVDPDADGAPDPLLNQASTSGNPPGGDPSDPDDDITDLSDSGADPGSTNPNEPGDTGGTDDPTPLGISSIGLAKVQTTAVRSTTNPVHWDVGFQLNVINNGTIDLENLSLVDDVAAQLGATYVAVTTAPAITASSATTDPSLGSFPVDVFSGTDGLLEPGQTITVDFVLEMNLTNAPIPLTNQAEVGANPVGGDPDDPSDDVSDLSDDGTDPVGDNPDAPGDDGAGGTDDPTPILVDSLGLAKEQTAFVPNGANFDVTYQLVMKNNGTTVLTNLTLEDDLAAQMGPVFIGVATAPSIVASTATTDPVLGSFIPAVFDGNSGVLEPGQEITVEFTVELNPAATGAVYPITNQAQAGGNSPTGSPMSTSDDTTDPSDAGSDPDTTNPDSTGDTGGQDDPTPLDIPAAVFGTVWLNEDGDNNLDAEDTRLDGWTIEIYDGDGNLVATTMTDADGNYRVEDLPSGDYNIRIISPEGTTMRDEVVFLPPGEDEEVSRPIDPSGVIYDSSTGEPIEGVTIIITDVNGVPLPDVCVQPGQQTQTTGEDGVYRFDLNPDADPACPSGATEYLLQIIDTPDEYLDTSNVLFPETGAMDDTPLGTDCPADAIAGPPCNIYDMPVPDSDPINNPAPFFLSFILETGDQDVIWNHIPLDIAATPASILLSKDVNKSEALIGDIVQYTLRAESQESFPLVNINLVDNLPGGFKYVESSANLIRAGADGVLDTGDDIVVPINAAGVDPVTFGTIDFAPNEVVLVRYFARISTGVTQGDYVNTAVAETIGGLTASNVATATVAIVEDPLLDKTTIIGKVFHDRDRDGYQDNADASGVKIGSEYFGWNSYQVGDISGRVRPTDPIEEHRAIVRMPYTEGGDNSFRVSTDEGTMINVDNNGEITFDHTGKKAHGMTGQDLRVTSSRVKGVATVSSKQIVKPANGGADMLEIVITNHGIQEEGIPGVRLATVDGLLIETDQYGRYHIADVSTGHFTTGTNYIVKVDDATLPEGTTFTTENPRVQRLTQSLMTRFNFGVALPQVVEEVATCEPTFKTVEDVNESVTSRTLDNVLEPIYFESGRSQIPADYADTVRAAMNDHADKQNLRLEFIGHTDNERLSAATTAKYGSNQGLSEARAKMVADKMAATLGLDSAQLMTSGRGDTQPAASNDTADGMALNRRVEVVLVYDEINRQVSTRQVAMDNCTTMVSENVTDVITKTATGVIDPILFISGKSDIPADYAAQLRNVIEQYKDKDNVRIRFAGHTDNERLSASTAAKYGDNQGLSEARARQVADALAAQLGLDTNAVEAVGYGESAPVASNATRDGMAQNRRVEIEVLYDEAVSKVRTVERVEKVEPSRISLPHGGMIWATEDPGKIDPRLDISASNAIVLAEGKSIDPVSFRIYTNYQAFIDRYEINVYSDHDRDLIRPLATINGVLPKHTETVEWMPEFADSLVAGKHMVYQLRVWDKGGRMDRTAPQLLKVVSQNLFDQSAIMSEEAAKADRELLETFGNSTLLQRTIPIYGSRVRIHGADVSQDYELTINGEPVYIDNNNRFVYEQQLPLGEHQFEVVVTGKDEQQWVRDVSVEVDGDYLFMVGMVNLTIGENDLNGDDSALNGDHRFDDSGFVDGRVAFYMKGKVKGKYLITAQLDTTEDDLDNLGDNIKRKDPQSVFRRLDPDQFYPVYGDDSTTISDVDTQGAFYLRADWDNNKALWGNFNTEFTGTEFAQYNRSLYGAQIVHKSLNVTDHGDHKTEVYGFISEAQTAQAHNEFIATGGSLYYLRETDIVRGSDKVWVEVRARDTERVIETVVLEEGRDYQIDYLQGRIILNRPLTQVSSQGALSIIRSQPLEGDDVVLMVDYEYVPTGFSGDDLTAGARGKAWLGDDLAVGVTYVTEDRDNSADYELMGLDVTYRISKGSWVKAEFSETESTVSNGWLSGNGGLSFNQLNQSSAANTGGSAMGIEARINLADLTDETLQGYINAWYKDREAGFSSTRENDGVDTTDTGIELQWEGDLFSLLARANQLETGSNTRTVLNLQGKYEVNSTFRLIAEVRNEDSENADANLGFTSGGQATLFALGGEYQMSEHTRLYGSAQTVVKDDASYESNDALTFGIESQLSEKLAILVELSSGDRGDALTLGVDYNLRDNLNLQIEASFGDAATSQIGTTFATASGLELYGSYAVDSDRTDNERRTLTIGQRKNFGESLRLFSEQQFTNDKEESGIGHIFGIDHRFTDEMSASVSLQHSDLSGVNGNISRDVGTVGLSFVDNKKKASTKLEYRKDDGAENTTQWLTTNALDWTHNEHLRYMLRLNMAVTKNDDTNVKDGKFIEADIGLAYRPAFNDRLNVLAKYSYLFDLPAQLSTGSLIGQNDSSTDERAHVLSAEALYDLRRKWEIGGKIAWRKGETRSARDSGPWFDSGARFAALRLRYHFIDNWDALAEYRILQSETGDDQRDGAMLTLHRHIGEHFKVGIGFNFTDFTDDLTTQDYDASGFFLDITGKW